MPSRARRLHLSRRFVEPPLIAVLVCAVVLIVGYVLKECPGAIEDRRSSLLCYSDVDSFFRFRGIGDAPFPYVQHDPVDGSMLTGGALEYPVLQGVFMWTTAQLVSDTGQYLALTALLLAPLALLIALLLSRMAGWRALLWSAAPTLALYAFHNWDLLAVAASVVGLWFWWRSDARSAGISFGVGAALKLYPIMFLVPLAFDRWMRGERADAVRGASVGLATAALINLPFLIINPAGWLATYRFHSARVPNYDSIWGLGFPHWSPGSLDLVTVGLITGSCVVVLVAGHRRAVMEGVYPFLPVCGALVASFLLWNKVVSPQYGLWLIPFLVLLRVNIVWWLAYSLNDLILYVSLFYVGRISLDAARPMLQLTVWGRAALLLGLAIVFLRAETVSPERDVG